MATWFEQVTGTSDASRDIYRQNKRALGGDTITQQSINRAQGGGVALSSPRNPNNARDNNPQMPDAVDPVRGAVGRRRGGDNLMGGSGGLDAYLDYIARLSTPGPRAQPPGPPTRRANPAHQVDTNITDPNYEFPEPTPAFTDADVEELERQLNNGTDLDLLAAGIAGAGVALAARELLRQRGRQSPNTPETPNVTPDAAPNVTPNASTGTNLPAAGVPGTAITGWRNEGGQSYGTIDGQFIDDTFNALPSTGAWMDRIRAENAERNWNNDPLYLEHMANERARGQTDDAARRHVEGLTPRQEQVIRDLQAGGVRGMTETDLRARLSVEGINVDDPQVRESISRVLRGAR